MQRAAVGEWAVVTGASEGIGRVFAQKLNERGFKILAVARNEERLKTLIAELGQGHRYLVADLSRADDVRKTAGLFSELRARILVNNAGLGLAGIFTESPIEQHLNIIRVNVDALTVLSHAFLTQARENDALINVASIVGLAPYPAQPVYAATKAYVTSLTESLGAALRRAKSLRSKSLSWFHRK